MAATNRCLAQSNKTRTGAEATKKRLDGVHDEHSALAMRSSRRRIIVTKYGGRWIGLVNGGNMLPLSLQRSAVSSCPSSGIVHESNGLDFCDKICT